MLVDGFGRQVTYLRLSVTDRCDFRCIYCMAEEMTFLPRASVLSLEELHRVAKVFIALGVTHVRLTGGEPLVRLDIHKLAAWIGAEPGLKELNMTTNGSQLVKLAPALKQAGVARLNISLDSLNEDRFKALTRTGNLHQVLAGIQAAKAQGFKAIKINSVILRGINDDEAGALLQYARDHELDISFIEEMPLGQMDDRDRSGGFIASAELRQQLNQSASLVPCENQSETGPSRYWQVEHEKTRVGFISPHSNNFCGSCNRVRVTVEGRLLLCLGNEHSLDLQPLLRDHPHSDEPLKHAIVNAMNIKPERHHFNHEPEEQLVRFMNMTGG